MPNINKTDPNLRSQYLAFKKLDKSDGQSDGLIEAKTVKGQPTEALDINKDGNITFEEFILGRQFIRLDQKDGNPDSQINGRQNFTAFSTEDKINTTSGKAAKLIQSARQAGWTEAEINDLIEIVFSAAGDKNAEAFDELNTYLDFNKMVLTQLHGITLNDVFIVTTFNQQDRPLKEKLGYLLTVFSLAAGCGSFYNREVDAASSVLPETIGQLPLLSKRENRELLCRLCSVNIETINKQPKAWYDILSSLALGKEKADLFHQLILRGKINTTDDFANWASIFKRFDAKVLSQIFIFLTVAEPKDVDHLRLQLGQLNKDQLVPLADLIDAGQVRSLDELKTILPAIKLPDPKALSYDPDYRTLPLNPKEAEIARQLQKILVTKQVDAAAKALDYIAAINAPEVAKKEGYAADSATINKTISWDKIINWLFQQSGQPETAEKLAGRLLAEIKKMPTDATLEQVKTLFKRVPNHDVLNLVCNQSEARGKIGNWLTEYWNQVRPLSGHIFLSNDKLNYRATLADNLKAQGLALDTLTDKSGFQATIKVVDLNSLETQDLPARFTILAENRVLVVIDINGQPFTNIINPSKPTAFIDLMRAYHSTLFSGENNSSYSICYFPKIEFQNGKYMVTTNYRTLEGSPETLAGKLNQNMVDGQVPQAKVDKEQRLQAYRLYQQAYRHEDQYLDQANKSWQQLTPELRAKIARNDKTIEFDKLFQIMQVMDATTAERTISSVFNLTDQELAAYRNKAIGIIQEAERAKSKLTNEELLQRTITAFDGRVMLASVVLFNTILSQKGVIEERYPNALRLPTDVKDPIGAYYHYYGTFFAAYALQKCVVARYNNEYDPLFKNQLDAKVSELKSKVKIDYQNKTITGLTDEEKLLFVQYRLIQLGGPSAKEMMSLAGIFKEEVSEDGDTSNEVFYDFKGMSGGHALFETLSGQKLTRSGTTLSLNDNRRDFSVKLFGEFTGAKVKYGVADLGLLAQIFDLSYKDVKDNWRVIWDKIK